MCLCVLYMCMYTHIWTHTCICICNDYDKKEVINIRVERHGRVWREGSCKGLKRRMEGRECFISISFKNIFYKNQKNKSQVDYLSSYSRFRSNVINQIVYFSWSHQVQIQIFMLATINELCSLCMKFYINVCLYFSFVLFCFLKNQQ